MFNKTLNNIARVVEDNLFNPDQATSPQPWHVPGENVFNITQTPDPTKTPSVVFTPGGLEADLRNRMETFSEQSENEIINEVIRPADHGFVQTYSLLRPPVKPMIRVREVNTAGIRVTLREGDDFVVDYKASTITFRDTVNDVRVFRLNYWTNEIDGTATTILLTQPFSIEVVGANVMKAEAICAIIIGVLEAFKEDILAKNDKTIDGLHVVTLLKPFDIQLVNKAQDTQVADNAIIMLSYLVPGIMHITRKAAEGELGIIGKIFHPDVVTSDYDVEVDVDVLNGTTP